MFFLAFAQDVKSDVVDRDSILTEGREGASVGVAMKRQRWLVPA